MHRLLLSWGSHRGNQPRLGTTCDPVAELLREAHDSQQTHRNTCHHGAVSAPQSTQSNGAEHRILVVDDEPSIVDAVATALRYEGYDVEEAGSGRDALAAVARAEPDLIILD